MKAISLTRFNALAGYARQPQAQIFAEELAWFEHGDGKIVGAIIRDRTDNDFGGLVFAQDKRLRFRWVSGTSFHASRRKSEVDLRLAMEQALLAAPEEHWQGDEKAPPVDFFAFTRPRDQLNPAFLALVEYEAYSPARQIIEPMMRWYEDADGNFVEQFQTTGFDQRIWELYLFAVFIEMGYQLDRHEAIPDFVCSGLFGEFTAEAVTVGPTKEAGIVVPPPPIKTREDMEAYLQDYMPIKFGSALFSKLKKSYWERPNVAGKPLLFAIEDFSSPMSMVFTRTSIQNYLFGYAHRAEQDVAGNLKIVPHKIDTHKWGQKEISSGFFDQPDAENVSAVLYSNSGTVAKFNRMGVLAGFGSTRVLLEREGTNVDLDPNASAPKQFSKIVNAPGYSESWIEGLDVFHNPRAKQPLDQISLDGAAHHYLLEDGQVRTTSPDWHPLGSVTRQWAPVDVQQAIRDLAEGRRPSIIKD